MKSHDFIQLMGQMHATLGVVSLAQWRRAMMRRVTVLMAGVLVLLYAVHAIEGHTGPLPVLTALMVLAKVLAGGSAVFIAWVAMVRTVPSWARFASHKKPRKNASV